MKPEHAAITKDKKLNRKAQDNWLRAYRKCRTICGACESSGIERSLVDHWYAVDQEFKDIKQSIDAFGIELTVNNLQKRADGYDFDEVTTYQEVRGKGKSQKMVTIKVTTTRKHMPPDTSAITFFLTNKAKKDWQVAQKITHDGKITIPQADLSGLTTDELKKLAKLADEQK